MPANKNSVNTPRIAKVPFLLVHPDFTDKAKNVSFVPSLTHGNTAATKEQKLNPASSYSSSPSEASWLHPISLREEQQSRFNLLSDRRHTSCDATFNSSRIAFKPQYC